MTTLLHPLKMAEPFAEIASAEHCIADRRCRAKLTLVKGGQNMPDTRGQGGTSKDDAARMTPDEQIKRGLISFLPRLRRYACTLTGAMQEADDLVQETCMRALAQSAKWDVTQPLDRWTFRIARNLWFDELRKRKVRLGEGQIPAEDSTELQVPSEGEATAMVSDLQRMILSLPSDQSELLLLVSVEGYSYREAADMLDLPMGTVMSRIYRARKTLSAQMDAQKASVS